MDIQAQYHSRHSVPTPWLLKDSTLCVHPCICAFISIKRKLSKTVFQGIGTGKKNLNVIFCFVSLWILAYFFNPTAWNFMIHTRTCIYTHKISNICQPYTKHGSDLSENWQVCYALHIHIYLVWAQACWPRPTSLHAMYYYWILSDAAQTQHGVPLKTAFLYFIHHIRTTYLHLHVPDSLTRSFTFKATFSKKLTHFQVDFPVPECLTNTTSQTFTMPWEIKMEAFLSIQELQSPQTSACMKINIKWWENYS